jgi:magnesium transporter
MLDKHLLRGDVLEALSRSPPATEDLRFMLEVAFPADIAEIVEDLTPDHQVILFRSMAAERAGEVLGEVPEAVQKDLLLKMLTKGEIAGILNEIEPDEGADLVELMPDERVEEALEAVDPEQAEAIRSLAEYDPESAGGRMTTEYVSVKPELRVADALETLRTSLDIESISYVYVVDRAERLVGVMSVRDILEADPEDRVAHVMSTEVIAAHVDDDQETASRLVDRYDLVGLPVVDDGQRMLGVLTVDDAMDVLEEEAEEDLALLSGSGAVGVKDPIGRHVRSRLPWLLLTLVGGLAAAVLVQQFKGTLDRITELVLFMPVMAGMAGSVGIQSSTVMVRGFATGEMVMGLAMRTVTSQIAVGVVVGAVCGMLTGVIALLLTGEFRMGTTVLLSMTAGITTAAGLGTLLPIACEKFDVDPAVAAGPFVTMLNDLIGLLIYFLVASLLLLNGS